MCPQVVQRGAGELRGAASSGRRFPSRGKVVATGGEVVSGGRFQGKPSNPTYAKRSKSSRQ